MVPECPSCGTSLKRGKCPECGWKPVGSDRPVVDKRCHGKTPTGRCTFRAEIWADGPGMCGWHHRVQHDDRSNVLEELEKWQQSLLRARVCDLWTHFEAGSLWDGMAGERGKERVRWCGGGDCPNGPRGPNDPGLPLLPGATTTPPPRASAPPEETRDAAWRQKVLEQAEQIKRGA